MDFKAINEELKNVLVESGREAVTKPLKQIIKMAKICKPDQLEYVNAVGNGYQNHLDLITPTSTLKCCQIIGYPEGPEKSDMRIKFEFMYSKRQPEAYNERTAITCLKDKKSTISNEFSIERYYYSDDYYSISCDIQLLIYDYEEDIKTAAAEVKEFVNFIDKIMYDAVQAELETKRKEQQAKDDAYNEIKRNRKEARKNKQTGKEPTVSITDIENKLKGLQNPTPEQLAKILAAIEG